MGRPAAGQPLVTLWRLPHFACCAQLSAHGVSLYVCGRDDDHPSTSYPELRAAWHYCDHADVGAEVEALLAQYAALEPDSEDAHG